MDMGARFWRGSGTLRDGRSILVRLAQYGHYANGHPRANTARVADEPFVDALVFFARSGAWSGFVYLRQELHRCLARHVLLFADDLFGLFVVSAVLFQAAARAFLACHCFDCLNVCFVRAALAMPVTWGRGCAVVAPFVAAIYADFADRVLT